jgi:hypothetical protein
VPEALDGLNGSQGQFFNMLILDFSGCETSTQVVNNMFIVRIILLDENHANSVLRGSKIKEIIATIIRRKEKWSSCEGQLQSFKSIVGNGIPDEL